MELQRLAKERTLAAEHGSKRSRDVFAGVDRESYIRLLTHFLAVLAEQDDDEPPTAEEAREAFARDGLVETFVRGNHVMRGDAGEVLRKYLTHVIENDLG